MNKQTAIILLALALFSGVLSSLWASNMLEKTIKDLQYQKIALQEAQK